MLFTLGIETAARAGDLPGRAVPPSCGIRLSTAVRAGELDRGRREAGRPPHRTREVAGIASAGAGVGVYYWGDAITGI